MANLKSLAKDTVIYGLSSIVGRFLNYLLVPLYTNYMPKESGDYGVSVNIYAYTALVLVLLTFGMETTLFRFANKEDEKPDTVFSTATGVVCTLSVVVLAFMFSFLTPISESLGYADHPDYGDEWRTSGWERNEAALTVHDPDFAEQPSPPSRFVSGS